MAFDEVRYVATQHVMDRFKERMNKEMDASQVERLVKEGKVILETKKHRYVLNGNYRFPCVKDGDAYYIKSVIVPGMVMKPRD